jgi:hypothetical protein
MEYMKTPCTNCPFRNDVTPFLHPERAAEIAYAALNPYQEFPCHKTTESDDEGFKMHATENSKECAGFLTLRAQAGKRTPEGFEPSWELCYADEYGMIDAYEQEWDSE